MSVMTFGNPGIPFPSYFGGILGPSSPNEHPGIPLYIGIKEFSKHEYLEFYQINRPLIKVGLQMPIHQCCE